MPNFDVTIVSFTVVFAALTSGCATITTGRTQGFTIATEPPAASCELSRKGKSVGVINPTPGTLQLEKSSAAIDINCKKAGYLTAEDTVSSSMQGWTFGNLILGGIIGLAVDAGSGAMHQYQSAISLRLLPESFESETSRDAYFDAWRSDLKKQFENTNEQINKKCSKPECEKLLSKSNESEQKALRAVESSRSMAKIASSTADGSVSSPNFVSPVSGR